MCVFTAAILNSAVAVKCLQDIIMLLNLSNQDQRSFIRNTFVTINLLQIMMTALKVSSFHDFDFDVLSDEKALSLGKPSLVNSAVFLTLFKRGGGGIKPMLQIFYYFKGLFGNIELT